MLIKIMKKNIENNMICLFFITVFPFCKNNLQKCLKNPFLDLLDHHSLYFPHHRYQMFLCPPYHSRRSSQCQYFHHGAYTPFSSDFSSYYNQSPVLVQVSEIPWVRKWQIRSAQMMEHQQEQMSGKQYYYLGLAHLRQKWKIQK